MGARRLVKGNFVIRFEAFWFRWGKDVFVYGEEDLKKTHPVLEFLSKERKAKSIHYYKEGSFLSHINGF